MKIFVILFFASFLAVSCSSSKSGLSKSAHNSAGTDYDTYENPYYVKKNSEDKNIVTSKKINDLVNQIIQEKTGNPISQIARSNVYKTDNGYQWKFTNVTTGQSYKIETNDKFSAVQVIPLSSITEF